jgi:branched-subunit amino acid ABC-type transport system permease component
MLVLGLVRVGVLVGVSARWQDPAVFLLLALGLYCRPNGILAPATRDGGAS